MAFRYNIKTYRLYANVVKSWYDSYQNGRATYKNLSNVFNTKMNMFDNPFKQANFEREIIRLIGRQMYKDLLVSYKNNLTPQ